MCKIWLADFICELFGGSAAEFSPQIYSPILFFQKAYRNFCKLAVLGNLHTYVSAGFDGVDAECLAGDLLVQYFIFIFFEIR